MNPIFSLLDVKCGYRSGEPVLHVPQLEIPAAKLTFIVGVSGGGKSTLLEALGMMNRTVQSAERCAFVDGAARTEINALWSGNVAALDAFRRKHFSFIFQKTNLIPNFTCGENMMLPALFKGRGADPAGRDEAGVKQRVLAYMDRIGLPRDIFDKDVRTVSGGQRQRLAFIRAMSTDFSVLFGDEPTGNLDPQTAREVMTMLVEHLHDRGKSGIVVSHDLKLANEFADVVVPIELQSGTGANPVGVIESGRVLYRNADGAFRSDRNDDVRNLVAHVKQQPVS